jgi:hypothetical protein
MSRVKSLSLVKGRIESVADCLGLVDPETDLAPLAPLINRARQSDGSLGRFHSGRPVTSRYGLWFRGHADKNWELTPTVFRKETVVAGGKRTAQYLEEVALFHSFKTRVSSMVTTDLSYFDWLCIMRHHALPTRLLDWSESALVALFFAVDDPLYDDRDSCLYVLNAYSLNEITGMFGKRSGLATPGTSDVVIRCCMALFSSYDDVFGHALKQDIEDFRLSETFASDENVRRKLRAPVAAVPNYVHNRLTVQSSVFTVHGGKRFFSRSDAEVIFRDNTDNAPDLVGEPLSLQEVDNCKPGTVLLRFIIPAKRRGLIRDHLERLGIHRGMLFPDLENQALYLSKLWRHLS